MTAHLTESNVAIINEQQGTNYPVGITYQNLYDSRTTSRGYFRKLNGKDVWILPSISSTIDMTGVNYDVIIELTNEEFVNDFEQSLDIIEDIL